MMRSSVPYCVLFLTAFVPACSDDASATGATGGSGEGGASSAAQDETGQSASASTTAGNASGAASTAVSQGTTGEGTAGSTAGSGSTGGSGSGSATSGTSESASGTSATEGSSSEGTMSVVCEAPGAVIACDGSSDDPFHAIGLGCPGGPNQVIPITNAVMHSPDRRAYRVARQFGSALDPATGDPVWGPREGERFLVLSTGVVAAPTEAGVILEEPGASETIVGNDNPDGEDLPAPITQLRGSAGGLGGTPFVDCDGERDCSDSLFSQWNTGGGQANDLIWMTFETEVPSGTHGYALDFNYFSSEFPEWVGSTFNDIFVIWSNSEAYTGNLCFVDDAPCTVTALDPIAYDEFAPELAGTGFDGVGGASGWYRARGICAPGETLQLSLALFDMGDSRWDTSVLVDHFRWDCEGCIPTEASPCLGVGAGGA